MEPTSYLGSEGEGLSQDLLSGQCGDWNRADAVELIEQALDAFRLRTLGQPDTRCQNSLVMSCLDCAIRSLNEATNAAEAEQARKDAIGWLMIALDSL